LQIENQRAKYQVLARFAGFHQIQGACPKGLDFENCCLNGRAKLLLGREN
jgi:hypothetical protein